MPLKEEHADIDSFLRECRRALFPGRLFPSGKILEMLQIVYPALDIKRIRFYRGMPWFTKFLSHTITAQALPATYSLKKFNIYLRDYDEKSCDCLSIIVHEAYHLLQYQEFFKGYGFGFLRGFIVYYNAYYLQHGYRNNPFEIPAYDMEYKFYRLCRNNDILNNPDTAENLRVIKTDFNFTGNFFFLFLSILFNMAISLLKPLTEGLLWMHLFFVHRILKTIRH